MFTWNISFLKSFWRNVSRLAFPRDGILHRFVIMKKYKLQRVGSRIHLILSCLF